MNTLSHFGKRIADFWNRISMIGVDYPENEYKTTPIRMVNEISITFILLSAILMITSLVDLHYVDVVVILSIIAFLVYLLYLNYTNRSRRSILLFNVLCPFANFLVAIFYGGSLDIAMYSSILIIVGIVCYRVRKKQYLVFVYNFILFSIAFAFVHTYGAIFPTPIMPIESYVSIVFGMFLIMITFRILLNERWDNEKQKEELVERLQDTNMELNEVNADLKNFTYVASHDLKSPLRAIINSYEIISPQIEQLQDNETKTFFSFAEKSASQMMNILNDLLVYSKHNDDSASIAFESVDLKNIVQQIEQEVKLSDEYSKAKIDYFDLSHTAVGNESFFKLLFQNLILNGIKYNESEKPHINIVSKITDGEVKIYFKDNGIGIDEKYQNQIFEPFKRLHNENEYTGTGFGLAICKKLTEKMNGKLNVISTPGEGSTFIVSLPN